MAKTLLMRPYVLCASSHLFLGRALPIVTHRMSLLLKRTPLRGGNKLEIHGVHSSCYGSKLEGSIFVGGGRGFSVRATTQVNDSGSIDSPLMQSMEKKIKEDLNAELVTVKDAYGDGRHVSIDVISSAFEGQSAVNRQRMVYKAIWEELQSTVHAVDQMTTRTPNEAAAEK